MKSYLALVLLISLILVSCAEDNEVSGKETGEKFVSEINTLSAEFVESKNIDRKFYDASEYGPLSTILNAHNRYLYMIGEKISYVDNLVERFHINNYVDNDYFDREEQLFDYLNDLEKVYNSLDMFLYNYDRLHDDYLFELDGFASKNKDAAPIVDSLKLQADNNIRKLKNAYQLKKKIYQKAVQIYGHLLGLKDHFYIKDDVIYFDNSNDKTKYEELEKEMNEYIDQLKALK